jgi:hypothetical protein
LNLQHMELNQAHRYPLEIQQYLLILSSASQRISLNLQNIIMLDLCLFFFFKIIVTYVLLRILGNSELWTI